MTKKNQFLKGEPCRSRLLGPRTAALMTLAACSIGLSAYARAPVVAPEPPRKSVAVPDGSASADEQIDTSRTVDTEQARTLLMEQLLRAAEAGIVTLRPTEDGESIPIEEAPVQPNSSALPSDVSQVLANEDAPDVATSESDVAAVSANNAEAGEEVAEGPVADAERVADLALRIKTSGGDPAPEPVMTPLQDPESTAQRQDENIASGAPAKCFSRAQLTLPDALPGEHLSNLIGEQRKALIGEFDTANPEPAIALAKTYLSVGMTHEARIVINEFAPDHRLGQFLLDIANVWIGEEIHPDSSLFKEDCIGLQALWRSFAQARIGEYEEALRSEVSAGAALEELPLHPRQVVASELGLAAAKHGHWDSARRLSAMANRAADGEGDVLGKTHLLSYRLAKWRNEPEAAQQHLTMAGMTDTDTATEALLIRAEDALRSEDVLNPSQSALRMDLGALARREIGTDLARRAFDLEARLFHRGAGADETINFLSDAVQLGLLDAEQHPSFLAELISKPAYSDVARPLAHIYLEDPKRFDDAIDQDVLRRSLVRSLAQNGVPGVAQSLLRLGDLEEAELATDLAQSFIEADEYREAIATLTRADDGIEQRLILSRAFLGMGDFEKAIAVLNEMPEEVQISPEQELKVSAMRMRAELAGKDYASALSSAKQQLVRQADASLAEQSALFALESGADDIPQTIRDALSVESEETLRELEDLFSINGSSIMDGDENLDDLIKKLEEVESSEKQILEIIENG